MIIMYAFAICSLTLITQVLSQSVDTLTNVSTPSSSPSPSSSSFITTSTALPAVLSMAPAAASSLLNQTAKDTCDLNAYFLCDHGTNCLPKSYLCDQHDDCADKSDEQDCRTCSEHEFKCRNSQCISMSKRCDHTPDCTDESDEADCALVCKPTEFKCQHDHICFPKNFQCNGKTDCPDQSDEANCTTIHGPQPDASPHAHNQTVCGAKFNCESSTGVPECINWHLVCDSDKDCSNGKDEDKHCFESNPCRQSGCAHQCIRQSHNDTRCVCDHAFDLMADHKRCQVKHPEHVWTLTLAQNEVISYGIPTHPKKARKQLNASAFAVSIIYRLLFWFDPIDDRLMASPLTDFISTPTPVSHAEANHHNDHHHGNHHHNPMPTWLAQQTPDSDQNVLLMDNVRISDLTVDCKHALVYFLDNQKSHLEVLSLETGHRHVLNQTANQASSVVLNGKERTVIWLEGGEYPCIKVIDQDGSNARTLLSNLELGLPVSLAINEHENKLYWADASNHKIKYLDLKSNQVKELYVDAIRIKSPVWLDVLGESVVWYDSNEQTLYYFNQSESGFKIDQLAHVHAIRTVRLIQYSDLPSPSDPVQTCAHIGHPDQQCSFMCLPGNLWIDDQWSKPKSTCVCPAGQTLAGDQLNCEHLTNATAANQDILSAQNSKMMIIAIILIIASAMSTIVAFFVLGAYVKSVRRQRGGSAFYRHVGEGDPLQCKQYNFDVKPNSATVEPISVNVVSTDNV